MQSANLFAKRKYYAKAKIKMWRKTNKLTICRGSENLLQFLADEKLYCQQNISLK